MKKICFAVLAVYLFFSMPNAATKYLGWSLGYYTTWDNSYSPANLPWNAFTHVAYFQVEPKADGTLNTPSDAVAASLIKEGHARGKKVIYCIGGAGVTTFTAACADGVRGKLISNMIAYMKKLGYDGIDTDWEESFNNTEFVAWHKDLRDSINKLNPVPSLTIAAEDWYPVTLSVSAYVDQVNDMYYSASANQYLTSIFPAMTKAGVPKAKCGAGMGISMGNSVSMDQDIANMVINNGYGGIIQWAITKNDNGTPNMTALAAFVNPNPTDVISANNQNLNATSYSFYIKSSSGGLKQICYTVPSAYQGSNLDVGIYDVKGALVKTLVHGSADAGFYSIPFSQTASGTYIVKLATNNSFQTSKAFITR